MRLFRQIYLLAFILMLTSQQKIKIPLVGSKQVLVFKIKLSLDFNWLFLKLITRNKCHKISYESYNQQ